MESELFDFGSCEGDSIEVRYYGVTLKQQIGEFPAGTKFDTGTLNLEKSQLSFYRGEFGVILGRYDVKLTVARDVLNSD